MRRLRILFAVALCGIGLLAAPVSAHGTTVIPANPGIYTWSDCVYDKSLPGSTFIEKFVDNKYKQTIELTCSGVRHIKKYHGFDNYTEGRIYNILHHLWYRETSKSNSKNWLYSALRTWGNGEYTQYYQGYVVASKSSLTIVSAYTKTNTWGGNDSWETCDSLKFP